MTVALVLSSLPPPLPSSFCSSSTSFLLRFPRALFDDRAHCSLFLCHHRCCIGKRRGCVSSIRSLFHSLAQHPIAFLFQSCWAAPQIGYCYLFSRSPPSPDSPPPVACCALCPLIVRMESLMATPRCLCTLHRRPRLGWRRTIFYRSQLQSPAFPLSVVVITSPR